MDLTLLLIGLLAGALSGLLGIGGGIILTPFLHYGAGLPWVDAVALSLFVIAVQSPIGIWRHARRGVVDWRLAWPLALAGAAGVWLGDQALPHLPVLGLKAFFVALLAFAAWRLGRVAAPRQVPALLPVAVGLGAGFVSRILGVGGGILTVPALRLGGTATHVAVATSLVAVFTNAALATGANLARGLAWQGGVVLAVAAIVGSLGGVRLAHALPEQGLRRVVQGGLAVVAGLIALDVLRNAL
ncbi:MAG: sulfite exporter TauE/SafE family protein [Thermoplasmatota archaeon]